MDNLTNLDRQLAAIGYAHIANLDLLLRSILEASHLSVRAVNVIATSGARHWLDLYHESHNLRGCGQQTADEIDRWIEAIREIA